jgi:hypothetical protein
MYNFDSEISWLPKYSIRSHKEYYFLNSKNQTNLNLTTYIYICKIINIYEIKYIYYKSRVYDESNNINVML